MKKDLIKLGSSVLSNFTKPPLLICSCGMFYLCYNGLSLSECLAYCNPCFQNIFHFQVVGYMPLYRSFILSHPQVPHL